MSRISKILEKIPTILASRVSIFIYLALFFYLVIMGLLALTVPVLSFLEPSANIQLILGNYTNVLSALGASIAAGAGVAAHSKIKELHTRHQKMQDSIDELHKKIDALSK